MHTSTDRLLAAHGHADLSPGPVVEPVTTSGVYATANGMRRYVAWRDGALVEAPVAYSPAWLCAYGDASAHGVYDADGEARATTSALRALGIEVGA